MSPGPARPAFVVDTSVAVKWVLERDEAFQVQALRLLEAYLKGRCVLRAPELLVFEVANALRLGRKKEPSVVLEALEYLRELGLHLEPLRWTTLSKTVEIASSCEATVYDSYFLAMALESDSILVTADELFLRKARRYPGIVSLSTLSLPA